MTNFNNSEEQVENLAESFKKFSRIVGTNMKDMQNSMYKMANQALNNLIIYEDETYTVYQGKDGVIVTKQENGNTVSANLDDLPENIRNEVSKEVL